MAILTSTLSSMLIIIAGVFLLQASKAAIAAMCANDKDDMKSIFITVLSFRLPLVRHKIDYDKYSKSVLLLYAAWLIGRSIGASLIDGSAAAPLPGLP